MTGEQIEHVPYTAHNPTPLLSTGKAAREREARTALENARLDFEAAFERYLNVADNDEWRRVCALGRAVLAAKGALKVAEQSP